MSFFRNTSKESVKSTQSAEPHTARRAVRYAAADNTRAALRRQFPGVAFADPAASTHHAMGSQAVATSTAQPMTAAQMTQTNMGVQNDFAQAA